VTRALALLALALLTNGAAAQQPNTNSVTMPAPKATWFTDSHGRTLGTVGALGSPCTDSLGYSSATPLNIPGQPIGQDSALNVTGCYDASATAPGGSLYYGNQLSSTVYSLAPGQDINAVLGTTVATQPNSGGSGVVGVGVVETPLGIAYGSELSGLCFVVGGCPQAASLQLEAGGNAQPNSPIGGYLRFMSGANGNSPFYAMIFGDGLHNSIQEGGSLFIVQPGTYGAGGFDLRCNGCLDVPYQSDGFQVGASGDTEVHKLQVDDAVVLAKMAGSGNAVLCVDANGQPYRGSRTGC
jgi:hypothetical protein